MSDAQAGEAEKNVSHGAPPRIPLLDEIPHHIYINLKIFIRPGFANADVRARSRYGR